MNTMKGEVGSYLIISTTEETTPYPTSSYAAFWKDAVGELHLIRVGNLVHKAGEIMTEKLLEPIFQESIDQFVERQRGSEQDSIEASI